MIQRIQSETGCRVKVDSSKDRTDPQAMSDVTLTGDDDQIDSATVSHKLKGNECVLTSSEQDCLWPGRRAPSKMAKNEFLSHDFPTYPFVSCMSFFVPLKFL